MAMGWSSRRGVAGQSLQRGAEDALVPRFEPDFDALSVGQKQ